VNTLTVTGASVNLTNVIFTGWTDGTDVININGTAGVDNLVGSAQRDIIQSGVGADFLYGNGGNDEMYGGNDADYMSGGNGSDYMSGGAGVETFFGGAGVDTIIGGAGDDLFYLLAGDGEDIIVEYAGEGNDRILTAISYSLSSGSEIETLSTDANVGTVDINLTGNTLNNVIIGNNGVNILDGRLGNDTLYGLGGGIDYFAFSTVANTTTNSDTIADWSSAGDLIFLDDAAFTGMAAGFLAASAFLSGAGLTAAATAAQRVIVNTTNGDLWWDQDGLGGVASVRFATVGAAHPIFNFDFFGI
jgi:Ca2+-binding RTX toxin-like protein